MHAVKLASAIVTQLKVGVWHWTCIWCVSCRMFYLSVRWMLSLFVIIDSLEPPSSNGSRSLCNENGARREPLSSFPAAQKSLEMKHSGCRYFVLNISINLILSRVTFPCHITYHMYVNMCQRRVQ